MSVDDAAGAEGYIIVARTVVVPCLQCNHIMSLAELVVGIFRTLYDIEISEVSLLIMIS